MILQVQEGFLRDSLTGDTFLAEVNGGQQMMRSPGHFAIGQELRLAQRTEVKDTVQAVVVSEATDIAVGGIMQMRRAQQQTATHHPPRVTGHATRIASIDNGIKQYLHQTISNKLMKPVIIKT